MTGISQLRLPRPTRRQALALLAFALGTLALSLAFEHLFGTFLPLNPLALRDWLQGWGAAAPLISIGLMVLAIVFTPMPSVPLDIAAGLAFGLVWGTLYTLVGAELGAVICFLLARRFGRPWLGRRTPASAMAQIDRTTDHLGTPGLFLMRLLPVFNFDWVSYGAGLTKMPLHNFALATFFGMLPPVIAIVAVGDAVVTDPRRAALIFGVLILFAVVPLVGWSIQPGARVADEAASPNEE